MTDTSFVDEELAVRAGPWRSYFSAKMGFRNHWYPAFYTKELEEGRTRTVKLLGENLLFKRIDGQVYAIRDRCPHRRVRFSDKIECHTKGTISCWYHGFTFRWNDGVLCDIIAVPESNIIGKKKVHNYPVVEAKGAVFVFIGDEGFPTPPLRHDVPPGFLDEDMHVEGGCWIINANWRLGCENGIDEIHRYLHRDSRLMAAAGRAIPIGHKGNKEDFEIVELPDGPKGIIDKFSAEKMFFEGKVEGQVVVTGHRQAEAPAQKTRAVSASMWLPCTNRVVGFPNHNLTHFEWCVPVDEKTHRYFPMEGIRVTSEADIRAYQQEFVNRWEPLTHGDFLRQDAATRESQQHHYEQDSAWFEEMLLAEDFLLIEWRKLASRHARGVQAPKHIG
jgi:carbazole 1,9a-dioxygenase terminal dioxygenase component